MIDLELASLTPLFPLSQAPDKSVVVKPSITVINETEFLILSWTGASTIGLFVNSDGDPVRGTLEWPAHPQAVCMYHIPSYPSSRTDAETGFDYPYITALLPNDTIEIHSLETQTIMQVVPAPAISPPTSPSEHGQFANKSNLIACLNGYMVPSIERSNKMRLKSVPLFRHSDTATDIVERGSNSHE